MAKARIAIDGSRHLYIAASKGHVALTVQWKDGTHWLPVLLSDKKARQAAQWILDNTKE